jgi:MFS family permease
VPQGVGIALSRLSGGLMDRWGTRTVVLLSSLLLIVGTLPFAFAGPGTSLVLLAGALVVRGIGLGAILMAVLISAYVGLAEADIPHASTTTRIAQQVGGSFGTAVLAVVLQHGLAAHPTAPAPAFDHAFGWALALSLPALVAALFVPGRPSAEPAAATPEKAGTLTEAG